MTVDSGGSERWKEDRELASRAKAGDRAALDAICRACYGSVAGHLEVLTGDRALAEDLAQETFVRLMSRIDHYRGEAALRTWLLGIAFNLARGYGARRRRRRALDARHRGHRRRVADSPEDELVAEQARLRLYTALERLPEEQREAFVLRVIEQVPLREAAEILEVPDSTVSYRSQRAEAQLRKWLDSGET